MPLISGVLHQSLGAMIVVMSIQAARMTLRLSLLVLGMMAIASCSGHAEKSSPALAPLSGAAPAEKIDEASLVLGANTPNGFLRPCQTLIAAGGVVELRCGEHRIVEFRKGASAGDNEQDLDDVMEVLQARFGELRETRQNGRIDSFLVRISNFRTDKVDGPDGIAVAISNAQGRYWVFACYKKQGDANGQFCQEAIATAARAGGLAYVEAKKLAGFGDGILKVPEGCVSSEGSRITCKTGQLSWSSAGGKSAQVLQDEAVAQIVSMAAKEKVVVTQSAKKCLLLGEEAECLHLLVVNAEKQEELHFVLAQSEGEERLVVCSFASYASGLLPAPCFQALTLQGTNTPR